MAKVALIESKPSRQDYVRLFGNEFQFERLALCSDPTIKKVLKRDVDLEINVDDYDWLILVGSECLKYFRYGNIILSKLNNYYAGLIIE